jgi:hypothetical protein
MTTTKPEPLLWLDEYRGIYIPRHFAISFTDRTKSVSGVDDETWNILEAGPDHEWYWEAWEDVKRDAIVTNETGDKYRVHQDGDCWLVLTGMEWSEEEGFFVWPETVE